MTVADQNKERDLRVLYGLLATSALHEIDQPADSSREREVYLINLVRLLDMYRYGKLAGRAPHGVLESKPIKNYRIVKKDLSAEKVEHALEIARTFVDQHSNRDDFVAKCRETLLTLAHHNSSEVDPNSVRFIKSFVSKLAEELRST